MLVKEAKHSVFHFAQRSRFELKFFKIYFSTFDSYNASLKYFQMLNKVAKSFVELLKEFRAHNSLHVNKAQVMLLSA